MVHQKKKFFSHQHEPSTQCDAVNAKGQCCCALIGVEAVNSKRRMCFKIWLKEEVKIR